MNVYLLLRYQSMNLFNTILSYTLLVYQCFATLCLPNTGRPLSISCSSITFHLPTSFSLSTGVSRLPNTSKLPCSPSFSLFNSTSATLLGFGFDFSANSARKSLTVGVEVLLEIFVRTMSGIRRRTSLENRARSWELLARSRRKIKGNVH